jgi:hypothetical protein
MVFFCLFSCPQTVLTTAEGLVGAAQDSFEKVTCREQPRMKGAGRPSH